MRKAKTKIVALLAAAIMLLSACGTKTASLSNSQSAASSGAEVQTAARLQDDFYEAINAEWLANAEIPAATGTMDNFTALNNETEELLKADFAAMKKGEKEIPNEEIQQFLNYYDMAMNYDARNALGAEPILPYLQNIEKLESFAQWATEIEKGDFMNYGGPFSFYVSLDMGDATKNALYATAAPLNLMDKSYYEDEATYNAMAGMCESMLVELLALSGKTAEEAQTIASEAMAFDKMLAPISKTAAEKGSYATMYNPMPIKDFAAGIDSFDVEKTINSMLGTVPEEIIVTDTVFFEGLNEILKEENFDKFKSWSITNILTSSCSYLSEDFISAGSSFFMALMGVTEMEDKETLAYSLASNQYSAVIGDYYGKTYFGEEAKQDVVSMVEKMIAVFEKRLEANDWLTSETRDKAIEKLKGINIQVAYADKYPEIFKSLKVDKENAGGFFELTMDFTEKQLKYNWAQYEKPADRTIWPLGAHQINAMYAAQTNTIFFPAAILQAPYYSLAQSPSQNYGGIGAVIAHEISHAFDPNGSQFDALGNINNWWTPADYAEFETRTKAMLEQFEGIDFAGGKVNGALTMSENVADLGGIACALEVVESLENGNAEEFFTNWAVIWSAKRTPEIDSLLLITDNHAPNKLRVNVQLPNFDEFYNVFDVKEGDGMYLAPEDRISIW